jgi:hypothetical protein
MARHLRGRSNYVWKAPEPAPGDLAYHEPFEAWITGRPEPVVADEDDDPDADWLIATHRGHTND